MLGEPRRVLRGAVPVVLAWAVGGCFGDWVSARTSPRREQRVEPAPKADVPPTPDDPCGAYLGEVARRCDLVFDGHLGEARCHAQVVRVMSLYRPTPASLARRARTTDRTQACTQHLHALPPADPPTREPAALGTACRAWAELLRSRCVPPLRTPEPRLMGCGSDLLAFESMLGGITFGRAEDYEPRCRDEVDRLTEASIDGGESGDSSGGSSSR